MGSVKTSGRMNPTLCGYKTIERLKIAETHIIHRHRSSWFVKNIARRASNRSASWLGCGVMASPSTSHVGLMEATVMPHHRLASTSRLFATQGTPSVCPQRLASSHCLQAESSCVHEGLGSARFGFTTTVVAVQLPVSSEYVSHAVASASLSLLAATSRSARSGLLQRMLRHLPTTLPSTKMFAIWPHSNGVLAFGCWVVLGVSVSTAAIGLLPWPPNCLGVCGRGRSPRA